MLATCVLTSSDHLVARTALRQIVAVMQRGYQLLSKSVFPILALEDARVDITVCADGVASLILSDVVAQLHEALLHAGYAAFCDRISGELRSSATDTEHLEVLVMMLYNNISFGALSDLFHRNFKLASACLQVTVNKLRSGIFEEQHWATKVL